MFENLTERLSATLRGLSGKARLSEENIGGALKEVRNALIEGDVALSVVDEFVSAVKQKSIGLAVSDALDPGQQFIKLVETELTELLGGASSGFDLGRGEPSVILLAGLQGVGKTTTAAKLALFLTREQKKRVCLVSADVYRPAAIEQLRTLASDIEVDFIESDPAHRPEDIVADALKESKKRVSDVLIVDTAGRLSVDDEMMAEIRQLHQVARPVETLFVVDAMTGQDAARSAQAFNQAIDLTGVILTKADGDSRGGAALSVKAICGKPIRFLGVGEKIDALELFHPDRLASRILGMGDILSLIEEAEKKVDKVKAEKFAQKLQKGNRFDLEDFKDQLDQMANMGGIESMLDKMPGMGKLPPSAQASLDSGLFKTMAVIIDSMTTQEKQYPDLISGSRKQRIAKGSGKQVQDVNRLMKQFKQAQKMMKKVSKKGGMQRMMRGLNSLQSPPFQKRR